MIGTPYHVVQKQKTPYFQGAPLPIQYEAVFLLYVVRSILLWSKTAFVRFTVAKIQLFSLYKYLPNKKNVQKSKFFSHSVSISYKVLTFINSEISEKIDGKMEEKFAGS